MQQTVKAVVLACMLAFSASQSFAVRPTIEYLDIPKGTSFTVTGVCPFNVYEVALANNEKVASFYNQAGQITFQILTGVNKWQFTNTSNGKTITLNASGPGRLLVQPGSDTVLFEGGGVSFFYVQNPPPGIPAFALTRGRVVAELDLNTGVVTNFIAQNGTVQDVCAMLQ